MEYVMVPVPAEHEQELLREVMRMSLRDIAHRWDEASAAKVDLAISPELRVLVRRRRVRGRRQRASQQIDRQV